jgi:hypothetical protein
MMNYKAIEEYIVHRDFSVKQNEIWVCDSEIIKKTSQKYFSDEQIPPKIFHWEYIAVPEPNKTDNEKVLLSNVERDILIEKLITKNESLRILENQPSAIKGFINLINNV